jgi:hypothetical protein
MALAKQLAANVTKATTEELERRLEACEPKQPYVYTPREILELNAKHAVISNLGGKCMIMEYVPSNTTTGAMDISKGCFFHPNPKIAFTFR